jgi:hypothetical protein
MVETSGQICDIKKTHYFFLSSAGFGQLVGLFQRCLALAFDNFSIAALYSLALKRVMIQQIYSVLVRVPLSMREYTLLLAHPKWSITS